MAPKKVKSSKKVEFEKKDSEELLLDDKTQPPQSDSAQVSEPQQSQSAQATLTTTESGKRKPGGPRSVCAMYKVVKRTSLGRKMKVTYDERGVPNGSARHTLQSYIGMLARTKVPIDESTWLTVNAETKKRIWLDVQESFKVSPQSESLVLKSAGIKWRQFKTFLTTKYVLPFAGQKKKLSRPPQQYNFVGRERWKKFVATRTNADWVPIHNDHSKRVNKRKYPHRTSRKGYIGLHEEEIKSGKLEVGEEPDRALLWKLARIPKDLRVDDELSVIHDKIDMLLEKKRQGEFQSSGSNDVLTAALETPEHSGRVRGVGGFITPTTYFNMPKGRRIRITKSELLARDHQRTEEMEKTMQEMEKSKLDMLSQIAQLKEMIINSSNQLPSPVLSSKGSVLVEKAGIETMVEKASIETNKLKPETAKGLVLNDEDDCLAIDPTPTNPQILKGPRPCELAVESIENIVAFGMVFPLEETTNNKIHGKPMPTGCIRVSVDGCIKPEALLPVPIVGKMEKVEQAVGIQVAWPERLIIFPTPTRVKKPQKQKSEFQKMESLFTEAQPSENVPKCYNLLYKHATAYVKLSGAPIQLPCDNEVFGVGKTIFVLYENLLSLLKFQMIGQAIIAAYMLNLHTMIRKDKELFETFAFIDPAVSYKLNDEFERYFVNRLMEGNVDRVFFLPHNQDMHWILSIIWDGEIYILNPLPQHTHFERLEKALINALKAFNAKTGRGTKIPKVKTLSGSPKQPGGHECGYVVMRYMKEIIEDKELTFATKWAAKCRKCYTVQQLDEVRFEAIDYIQANM